MKKILTVLLGVFLLLGCSQQQNEEVKNEAIQAYVDGTNKIVGQDNLGIKLNGTMDVSKSAFIEEEVKGSIDMNGVFNAKDKLMKFDINVKDDNNEQNNENFVMYMDKDYLYMNAQSQWMKQAVDAETKKSLEQDTADAETKMTVEDAKEMFDTFKDTKYTTETVDGEEGYKITCKMDLNGLIAIMKTYAKETSEDIEKQTEQLKAFFNKLDVTYNVFIPKNTEKPLIHSITLDMEILKSPMSIGPIDIEVSPSTEKVVIPKEAKKAKEITDSTSLS